MNPRFQISRGAIELIKRFEGYRQRSAQLPDGRWTIGYGHTQTARAGAVVSEPDAEALLIYDTIGVAHAVNENVFTPLTQNQFDALVCFAFNIGVDNFRRSAVLRRVNEGQLIQAAYEMELWRKSDFEGERILIDALVRRRSAEKTLFLKPANGWTPAPSPVLPPRIDVDTMGLVPAAAPVVLTAPMDGERAVAERQTPAPAAEAPASTATEVAATAITHQLSQILPESEAAPEIVAEPEPETVADTLFPEPVGEPFAETADETAQAPIGATFDAAVPVDLTPQTPAAPVETPEAALDVPPIPAWQAPAAPEDVVEEAAAEAPEAETPAPLPTYATIGETDFALTPAAESEPQVHGAEPAAEPETHAEPEPELFDPARAQHEPSPESEAFRIEPTRALAEANPSPRILIDDTSFDAVETFDATYAETAKPFNLKGVAPLLLLALLGLVFFGAGLVLGFTTGGRGDLSDPMTLVGWGLGIVGIGCFAVSVYLVLNRLVGEDKEDI
ncbi:MAG: Lysozyme [Caulobacter sp.]|nr:Lysozyme [Caulobacter sp.]